MPPAPKSEDATLPDDRYRLGEVIGRGGLGEVYRAEDTQLCRWVAMKRLHGVAGESGEGAERILAEARHLAALQHPNIVTVYDVIASRGDVVVVMELLQGRTLQEIAEKAPLPAEDFVAVMSQALQGLVAAHACGMLHRDIKPSNLMLSQLPSGESQLKILDFGMAKKSPGPEEQTKDQDGALMGSIYMMAPEQLEGRPLDVRSDLYSLGCVAYFALTGCYPFSGRTVVEVITAHLQGRRTPLRELRPDLPPRLVDWVDRLMAVHPEDRFSTAAEALEILRATQPAAASSAPQVVFAAPPLPELPDEHDRPSFRLPRIRLADVLVVVFLLAMGVLGYYKLVVPSLAAGGQAVRPPAGLAGRVGETIELEGIMVAIGPEKAGFRRVQFWDTREGDLPLAVLCTDNPAEQVRRLNELVGQRVRISGVLTQVDGAPQVLVDAFSQIRKL